MKQITVDGLHVEYIDQGQGCTILLLHGWGAPAYVYQPLIDHLSGYCRVIAPDLPGFGATDEPAEPWNVDDYDAFTRHFAAALDIQEAVLMGHSFGGRIIIKMLSRKDCPIRVKKAVLIDAAGIKPKRSVNYYAKVYSYKTARFFFRLPVIRKLYPDAIDKARAKAGSSDYQNASPVMRQTMVRAINEDLTALLPRISASTLLIWGEKDTATPLSDGQTMERLIPDAGLVVLAGAGHFSYAECFGQCSRVLDSFLK